MKVCFPSQKDSGVDSIVYNHFGSAPFFVVVDTISKNVSTIANQDQHHVHGACNPIKAIGGQDVEAVVVGGIGGGALTRLNQLGIRVYHAASGTVQDNLDILLSSGLPEYTLQSCCGGHTSGSGCSH